MKENSIMENKKSMVSNLPLGKLMRVSLGFLLFSILMAAATNLSAQIENDQKEQAIVDQFRGKVLRIQAKHSGLYLDVNGQSQADGADVSQWASHPGNQQRWIIEPVPGGGGKVYIIAMHSGKFLDLIAGNTANEAGIGQWPYQDPKSGVEFQGRQQMWWLEKKAGGYWKIRNDLSGKYLDVLAARTGVGAPVSQWDDDPGDQQLWKIDSAGQIDLPVLKTGIFSSDPPALTGLGEPSNGVPVVVENILVPFFLIRDETMKEPSVQVSRSPYYVMSTSKQWVAVKFDSNPGSESMDVTVTETKTTETSMRTEIEQTVSATVTAKVGSAVAEMSASISASRTEKSATGQVIGKSQSDQRTYKVGPRSSQVFWNAKYKVRLTRLEGDQIKSWEKPGPFILKNTFSQKDPGQ